jgi:hypothetical protein
MLCAFLTTPPKHAVSELLRAAMPFAAAIEGSLNFTVLESLPIPIIFAWSKAVWICPQVPSSM